MLIYINLDAGHWKARDVARPLLTVEEMAARKHVRPGSIRSAHYRAQKIFRRTGQWPKGFPRPDRGRPLLGWDEERPDVIAYLADDAPELHDRAWLAAQTAHGKYAYLIADELGVTRRAVLAALDTFEIEPAGGRDRTRVEDVPLDEIEAALVTWTQRGVAEMYDVTPATLRHILRRKRAEVADRSRYPQLVLVDQLELSFTLATALWQAGVRDAAELTRWTDDDLRAVPGVGARRAETIKKALAAWADDRREQAPTSANT